MCDSPAAGVVATVRDAVSCSWIFYSNADQSGAPTTGGGAPSPPTGAESGERPPSPPREPQPPDPNLESMHFMLDPHLRPGTPDLTDETSVGIYQQHNRLTKEYLKVQTELAYLSRYRRELMEQHADREVLRQKREVMQLEDERDSLMKLYRSLRKQLEGRGVGVLDYDDDWELVPGESPRE